MKLRRSLLQFGVSSLLLLTLLVALCLGWFMTEVRRARSQAETVRSIEKSGGGVLYRSLFGREFYQRADGFAGGGFLAYVVDVDFRSLVNTYSTGASGTADVDLAPLERLPYVERLNLAGAYQLTDTGFQHLERLTQMRALDLTGTPMTDAGLQHLGTMTKLEALSLVGTRVSDRGLERLSRLTHLTTLDLMSLRITDAGLRPLARLNRLRRLSLVGTFVTDRGLKELEALTQLEKLYVWGSQVSPAGVNRLRAALPRCTINETALTGEPSDFSLKE